MLRWIHGLLWRVGEFLDHYPLLWLVVVWLIGFGVLWVIYLVLAH